MELWEGGCEAVVVHDFEVVIIIDILKKTFHLGWGKRKSPRLQIIMDVDVEVVYIVHTATGQQLGVRLVFSALIRKQVSSGLECGLLLPPGGAAKPLLSPQVSKAISRVSRKHIATAKSRTRDTTAGFKIWVILVALVQKIFRYVKNSNPLNI
jgi:hypothetical protein